MAVESRFNPIAESVMGAKGLMQVIPKFHQDKLEEHGGEESVLDSMTNILVGTRILKDAMRRGGSLMPGLQLYAGAFSDDGQQYAQKVIAEKERMQQTLKRAQPHPARRRKRPRICARPDQGARTQSSRNLPSRRTPSRKSSSERV